MKYVIIGNSTAAVGTIEGIRSADRDGEITVISSEPHHTYSRPLISYLLQGKTDIQRMKYRPDDFYSKNKVSAVLGRKAVSINSAEKTVVCDDGSEYQYDKLMIASGSSPFIPKFDGLDTVSDKFTFMSLDDALSLEVKLDSTKQVLIVGAGLIGLKCAEGIYGRCGGITVIDLAPRVLSSILDDETAAPVQAKLEEHGIKFVLGHSASSFSKAESGYIAELDDGSKLNFDILVLAVGVRANTALAAGIGAEIGRGIKTDFSMRTSVPDVYAAGDCTESYDISCDTSRILALLPNAYLQGETAGRSMAGEDASYETAVPMNAIGFFGYHIITAGSYTGEAVNVSEGRRFFVKDGLLKGYMLTGDVDKAGIYTSLIRNKTPLSEIDFDLIAENPSLMAFTRDYRDTKLTKPV